MKFVKLISAFGNMDKIYEGIKNKVFKREHVEAAATLRWEKCKTCKHLDKEGKQCEVPGTQPCCAECGCSLAIKLRSLSSECPIGKWNALMTEEAEDLIMEQLNYED